MLGMVEEASEYDEYNNKFNRNSETRERCGVKEDSDDD